MTQTALPLHAQTPRLNALITRQQTGARFAALQASALPPSACDQAQQTITQWPQYEATPCYPLNGLAHNLGIAALDCKDEGPRFGLGSFKALGGAYAVAQIASKQGRHITVTCATEGNHGRSVAWGAQNAGLRCVIFLHENVSASREQAIAQYGAEIIRVAGNYDDAVRQCTEVAQQNGWQIVSDTSWEGYEEIPRQVMAGYSLIATEIAHALSQAPTHVFLQAGVGGIATAMLTCLSRAWPMQNICFVVVEPLSAACLQASALEEGRLQAIKGPFNTLSAGLACGEPAMAVLDVLYEGIHGYLAIDDEWIKQAVRLLAKPVGNDAPIVAGVSGAAGLGGLLAALDHDELKTALGLNAQSRVLIINTENDTDPAVYQDIIA